eukprot:6923-Heterococcus_DN1.PRE.2
MFDALVLLTHLVCLDLTTACCCRVAMQAQCAMSRLAQYTRSLVIEYVQCSTRVVVHQHSGAASSAPCRRCARTSGAAVSPLVSSSACTVDSVVVVHPPLVPPSVQFDASSV